MSFQIERKTISLMREALERRYLTSISPARIRNELSLCFIEKKRYEILQRIGEFGIFKQLNLSYPGKNFFKELDEFAQRYGVESEGLYFVMLADEGDDTSLLTKRDLRLLNSVRIIEKKVPLLRGKTKLGEIYEILDGFPRPSLVYTGVKRRLKKKISLYFEKIEPVRPEITGDDIRNIGISDGKKIGYILRLVKKKKLDGLVSTKDDELNLVREFASNDRPVE